MGHADDEVIEMQVLKTLVMFPSYSGTMALVRSHSFQLWPSFG